jgi:glycosyltransferase involved in cell wall biosynthesis
MLAGVVTTAVGPKSMRILLAHCRYRQRGGEDAVFDIERAQLTAAGHVVESVELNNDEMSTDDVFSRLQAGVATVWSRKGTQAVRRVLEHFRPAVMHVHNFFPQMSPRIYHVAKAAGVPVVQTLHNYRLLCANAMFLREGRVCEDCTGGRYYRAVLHRCYRDSCAASAAVAAMQSVHHGLGTFRHKVDRYIALSQFARGRFIAGGLPAERVVVKPNSLAADPGPGGGEGGHALFVGRLSPEKGVLNLLAAWHAVPGLQLLIAGDGPLRQEVERQSAAFGGRVRVLGQVAPTDVCTLMQQASILVMPSEWYEGFPMTIVESYACGTPVVAARIGSLAEVVLDGETGAHFDPGRAQALSQAVLNLAYHPARLRAMRVAARKRFEQHYTGVQNVAALEQIYADAAEHFCRRT